MKLHLSTLALFTCSLAAQVALASGTLLKHDQFSSKTKKNQYLSQMIASEIEAMADENLILSTSDAMDYIQKGDYIRLNLVKVKAQNPLQPPELIRAVSTYGYEAPAPSDSVIYHVTDISKGIPHSKGSGVYTNQVNPPTVIRLHPDGAGENVMLFWYINQESGCIEQFEDGAEIADIDSIEFY